MRQAIYQTIIDDLLAAIADDTLKPGDRVWSIREIEERYGVSQITALRVFKELAASGKIIRRDGTGYFVASQAPTERGNAIVAAFRPLHEYNSHDNYGNRILDGIMRGTFNNGLELRVPPAVNFLRSRVPSQAETRRLAEEISAMDNVAGVIFDLRFTDEVLRDILLPACRGAKAVVAGRSSTLPIISAAAPVEKCGRELAQFALRCGGKRFMLFPAQSVPDSPLLIAAFRNELLNSGITPTAIGENPDSSLTKQRDEELLAEAEKIIRARGGYPVFFSATDSWGWELCTALTNCGFRVREDFGILTYGGYELAFTASPKLSCAVIDAEQIGRLAAEAIMAENAAAKGVYFTDYKIVLNETL